jgi:hypothetical protein
LSSSPIPSTSPTLGGGEFGTSLSDKPDKEGSVDGWTLISPEQALYNVLQVVFDGGFDGTAVGPKCKVSDRLGQSSSGSPSFPSFAPSNFETQPFRAAELSPDLRHGHRVGAGPRPFQEGDH